MKPEIIKKNEQIKTSMFFSIFGILVFMLSSYLVYFYNTDSQRLLREDSVSFLYVSIAVTFSILSFVIAAKAIFQTYKIISQL